jgi:hypothetical protein
MKYSPMGKQVRKVSSTRLLTNLEIGISKSSESVFFDIKLKSKLSGAPESLTSNMTVVVLASHTVHQEMASALSWISAAVRHSSYNVRLLIYINLIEYINWC